MEIVMIIFGTGLIVAAISIVWINQRGLEKMAEKRAIKELERKLFPNGDAQKSQIISAIHQITSNRLSDDLVLDYFLKIKGLQVINLNDPINFWTRKYLMSSTKVKLNYFEQVKFYETFLNFPEGNRRQDNNTAKSPLSMYPLTDAAQQLIKSSTKNMTKKLA
jgi:hypothetical protein